MGKVEPLLFLALVGCTGCGRVGFDQLDEVVGDASLVNPDAIPGRSRGCSTNLDSSTVALYRFDNTDNVMGDEVGTHPGDIVGDGTLLASREDCGTALYFAGQANDFGLIPNDEDWQIPIGSVDFWFLAEALPTRLAGLLSRDADGTVLGGHLGIALDSSGRLAVRIQHQGDLNGVGVVCSSAGAVYPSVWTHVGVNWGGSAAELWLNGESVNEPGALLGTCQTGHAGGIAGNMNPWTVGVASWISSEGSDGPRNLPFQGLIDDLRISRVRRDFSQ